MLFKELGREWWGITAQTTWTHTLLSDIFFFTMHLCLSCIPHKNQIKTKSRVIFEETWIKIIILLALQKATHDSKNAHIDWKVYLRAVSKSETWCNLQCSTRWLLSSSKRLLLNSIVHLILDNQTQNQTSVHVDIFLSWDWISKSSLLRQRKEDKKRPLDFRLGVVPGFAITLISPWVTLVPSICQTFPFGCLKSNF